MIAKVLDIRFSRRFFFASMLVAFVGNIVGLLMVNWPRGDFFLIGTVSFTILLVPVCTALYLRGKLGAEDGMVLVVLSIMLTFVGESFLVDVKRDEAQALVVLLYDMQTLSLFLLFLGLAAHRYFIVLTVFLMLSALVYACLNLSHFLIWDLLPLVGFTVLGLGAAVYRFRQTLEELFTQLLEAKQLLQQDHDQMQELQQRSAHALREVQDAEQRILFKGKRAVVGALARSSFQAVEEPYRALEKRIRELQGLQESLEAIVVRAKQNMRPGARRELDAQQRAFAGQMLEIFAQAETVFKSLGRVSSHSLVLPGRACGLDLPELLGQAVQTVRKEKKITSNSLFRMQPFADNGMVEGVRNDLEQVFVHLYRNAWDAVQEKALALDASYEPWISTTLFVDQDCLCVAIEDNGNGIPDFVQENLFEPFVTTKAPGAGVGLGLYTSRAIVEQGHLGSLSCTSLEGTFTRMLVRLPRRRAQRGS